MDEEPRLPRFELTKMTFRLCQRPPFNLKLLVERKEPILIRSLRANRIVHQQSLAELLFLAYTACATVLAVFARTTVFAGATGL